MWIFTSNVYFFYFSLSLSHPISILYDDTISLKRFLKTHLKRGLHLSIIPPPLTIKKRPLDHFWSRCLPPVCLLQVVGLGSRQSSRILVRALWSFSMKPTLPPKEDFDRACHLGSTVPPLETTTFNQTNSTTIHWTLFAMIVLFFWRKLRNLNFVCTFVPMLVGLENNEELIKLKESHPSSFQAYLFYTTYRL